MTFPARVLKWTWPLACVAAWSAFAYLAMHRSQDARVLDRWSPGFALLVGVWGLLCVVLTLGLRPGFRAALGRRRAAMGALTLGGVLALVLGEVLMRMSDPLGFSYLGEMQRYIGMRTSHDLLVYGQPQNQTVELDGVSVRYNSLGLRGGEVPTPKPENERRILFLGDSVAFGWGVEEDRIFATRLPEMMSESSEHSWRGINAGVCSYNTEQEDLYLELSGMALKPDLVVLVLIDNDVMTYAEGWRKQAQAKRRSPIRRVQSMLKASHLYKLVQHSVQNGLGGIALEGEERSVKPGTPGWEANMQALTRLVGRCQEAGLPLALFHFRWKPDPWSDEFLASARAAAGDVPIIDTALWFEDASLGTWVNSRTDSHPNPQAHERTARRMLEHLQKENLIRE